MRERKPPMADNALRKNSSDRGYEPLNSCPYSSYEDIVGQNLA